MFAKTIKDYPNHNMVVCDNRINPGFSIAMTLKLEWAFVYKSVPLGVTNAN